MQEQEKLSGEDVADQHAAENGTDAPEEHEEMGFFDHLEEFRKRIIWALVGLVVGCALAGFFIDELMEYVLLRPAQDAGLDLQNFRPFGLVFFYFKIVFMAGLTLSFPYVLHQVWLFIAPGLYNNERTWARKITFFTTLCFICGICFAYFLMIPSMLSFASGFGTEEVEQIIEINYYFGFVTTVVLGAGLIFELPMVTYVLASVGMLSAPTMRKYRRHAIVAILIIAAILTPSPDPVNQMMFAVPLWVLYEISIFIAKFAAKKRAAAS